jgi:hypothetical protein
MGRFSFRGRMSRIGENGKGDLSFQIFAKLGDSGYMGLMGLSGGGTCLNT